MGNGEIQVSLWTVLAVLAVCEVRTWFSVWLGMRLVRRQGYVLRSPEEKAVRTRAQEQAEPRAGEVTE